MAVSNVNGPF